MFHPLLEFLAFSLCGAALFVALIYLSSTDDPYERQDVEDNPHKEDEPIE